MARANDPTLDRALVTLREQMNNYADNIAGGGCHTMEEYRHQTGVIEGLVLAERTLLDIDEMLSKQ